MATYKVLGQALPAAATATALYTPAAQAIGSTLTVCNQSATATTYRIAIRVGGVALATNQYIAYDTPIAGNSTMTWTIGLSLGASDIVIVYATLATVSFALFGVESP